MTDIVEPEQATYTVQYGDREIPFVWRQNLKDKATRRARIHVHPDGVVEVQTPQDTSLEDVKAALLKRARWITQHLKDISERRSDVLERHYVSGETIFYRGRRYVLKICSPEQADQKTAVKLIRGQVRVFSYNTDPETIKTLLTQWHRERAKDVFAARLQSMADRLPWVTTTPEWQLRAMKSQWGSCSPQGRILLNPNLVKATTQCIDYVILHELSHLKEHNHGAAFYALLDQAMPDWEDVKSRLDGMAELYLNG